MGGLIDSFIGKSARSGDNSDSTSLMDKSGHDTDLTFVGLDNTGTVRSNHSGDLLGSKGVFNSDHIMLGDTISNGNNKVKFGLNGIDDGIGGKGWGDIDDRGVTSSLFFSI